MKKKLWILSFIMAMVFMMAGANLASAYIITPSNGSSSAEIIYEGADSGMTSWIIGGDPEGTSQLTLQWFWFTAYGTTTRLGDLVDLGNENYLPLDVDADENGDSLVVTYNYPGLEIIANYAISGSAIPPSSHIDEDLTIRSTADTISNFVIYEYNNFDLVGTPENDWAVAGGYLGTAIGVHQQEESIAFAEVSRSVAPATGRYEISSNASALLDKVIAGGTLSNTPGFDVIKAGDVDDGDPNTIEYDDIGWAFSWQTNLAAPNSDGTFNDFTITKDKVLVTPVPTTLLLLGSGLFSLLGVGIRRRKS